MLKSSFTCVPTNHDRDIPERKYLLGITIPEKFNYNPNMFIEPPEQVIHHRRLVSTQTLNTNKRTKEESTKPPLENVLQNLIIHSHQPSQFAKPTNQQNGNKSMCTTKSITSLDTTPPTYSFANGQSITQPLNRLTTSTLPTIKPQSKTHKLSHSSMSKQTKNKAPAKEGKKQPTCSHCSKTFSHYSSLSRHISKQHSVTKGSIKCNQCDEW